MTHTLTAVTRTQGANRALKEGTVAPEGFGFAFEEVPVLVHAFRRMVRTLEYDVCEMALTTYLTAREHGVEFTALPVFLVRGFHHGAIQVNTRAGIKDPTDLEGRRVGVNRGYTVTTGVWARGILAREYGVDLDRVTWVLSGDEHVASYVPPPNVVPAGKDLEAMLVEGEVDAVVGAKVDHPDVAPLIPFATEAAYDALVRRGLYPINHLVTIRDSTLREHPAAARAVFDAFAAAKTEYVDHLRATEDDESDTADDRMYRRVIAATGADPLPYGIEPNRAMLEELVEHARGQHILREPVRIEDLFAPATRELEA